jgi:hypothetical protein
MGREISLVDDQQIAAQDAGAAFARNIVAARDVDDEDPPVNQIEREGRGEIVAARFEQDQLEARKRRLQLVARRDVERRVLPDHGVGAGARFDGGDARGIDEPGAADALGVLAGDEIVGDDGEIDAARVQDRDELLDQRRLAGADRAADAHPRGGAGLG